MVEFQSLTELVDELEVGDNLLWVGEHAVEAAGETSKPNEITAIERDGDTIRVEGEGARGGQYHFEIELNEDSDENSAAYYHNSRKQEPTYKGPVTVARLTDSDEPVPVRRVYDDIR